MAGKPTQNRPRMYTVFQVITCLGMEPAQDLRRNCLCESLPWKRMSQNIIDIHEYPKTIENWSPWSPVSCSYFFQAKQELMFTCRGAGKHQPAAGSTSKTSTETRWYNRSIEFPGNPFTRQKYVFNRGSGASFFLSLSQVGIVEPG